MRLGAASWFVASKCHAKERQRRWQATVPVRRQDVRASADYDRPCCRTQRTIRVTRQTGLIAEHGEKRLCQNALRIGEGLENGKVIGAVDRQQQYRSAESVRYTPRSDRSIRTNARSAERLMERFGSVSKPTDELGSRRT
jgi:hypothetical protein